MLGCIANNAPIVSRNSIVEDSTNLGDIWQNICEYYDFQTTGSQFLQMSKFRLLPNERPAKLYQRLIAFWTDNLLLANSPILHHGNRVAIQEVITPALENTIVVFWMMLIHPDLPDMVLERYGTEMEQKTVSSLRTHISSSIPSMLRALKSGESASAARVTGDLPQQYGPPRPPPNQRFPWSPSAEPTETWTTLCTTSTPSSVCPVQTRPHMPIVPGLRALFEPLPVGMSVPPGTGQEISHARTRTLRRHRLSVKLSCT